jgi:hypothetical protein
LGAKKSPEKVEGFFGVDFARFRALALAKVANRQQDFYKLILQSATLVETIVQILWQQLFFFVDFVSEKYDQMGFSKLDAWLEII